MKTIKNIHSKIATLIIALSMIFVSCERELSDEAILATFGTTAEIFTDNFVGLGSNFYFPYSDGFAKPDIFEVDNSESYLGTASLRIDVPNANDPAGVYVGAFFRIDGAGRDLRGYDALTFWVKSTQAAVVESFGFGQSETANFQTSLSDVQLSTTWQKVIIPIPDASKLTQEKGMFWLVATPDDGDGYSMWIDELKFENLGNIGQPRPQILGGVEGDFVSVPGQSFTISSFRQTFNLGNGLDITVDTKPDYFSFSSSNPSVATVSDEGIITVLSTGEAQITASVGGVTAEGLVNVRSFAEPRIISIFSDFYANVPVDNYNGFYEPFQTTLGGAVNEGGNNIIQYTNLNFVGIEFYGRDNSGNSPIDASQMTHLNLDLRVDEPVQPTDYVRVNLINRVGNVGGASSEGSFEISGADLATGQFRSFKIPLSSFAGLNGTDALGIMLFISDATIANLSVDNIYFEKVVIDPTDNVDDSAATQVAFPVGFESTTLTYDIGTFAGANSAVETNPDQSGINPTSRVLRSTKTNGAQFFAGTTLALDAPVDFSSSQKVRMKVWSPKAGIPIRIKLENSGNPTSLFVELDANTTKANEWEELEWDFSTTNFNVAPFDTAVIFFEFVPGVSGDGSIYYCDDLKVLN